MFNKLMFFTVKSISGKDTGRKKPKKKKSHKKKKKHIYMYVQRKNTSKKKKKKKILVLSPQLPHLVLHLERDNRVHHASPLKGSSSPRLGPC